MNTFCFIVSTICFLALNDAAPTAKNEQNLIIRGRVIFPGGSRTPIESNAKLTVELQDTSLADAAAKVIARGTNKVSRFPIAFAIKYPPSQIMKGHTYSLSATIRNKKNELLYINDVRISINPSGVNRTKVIDVPVILVKASETTPKPNKTSWPELVGKTGEAAVKIIKQETGFTNVATLREGSPMTLDYRTDRVRVIVNDKGIVTSAPTIG